MKNLMKNFMNDKNGASNVEIIVWISVVLVIATVLFLFRDSIMSFIEGATDRVDTFQTE